MACSLVKTSAGISAVLTEEQLRSLLVGLITAHHPSTGLGRAEDVLETDRRQKKTKPSLVCLMSTWNFSCHRRAQAGCSRLGSPWTAEGQGCILQLFAASEEAPDEQQEVSTSSLDKICTLIAEVSLQRVCRALWLSRRQQEVQGSVCRSVNCCWLPHPKLEDKLSRMAGKELLRLLELYRQG